MATSGDTRALSVPFRAPALSLPSYLAASYRGERLSLDAPVVATDRNLRSSTRIVRIVPVTPHIESWFSSTSNIATDLRWSIERVGRRDWDSLEECARGIRRTIWHHSTVAELFDLAIERRFANPELLRGLAAIAAHGSKH